MNGIASIFVLLLFFCGQTTWSAMAGAGGSSVRAVPDQKLVEKWKSFDGKKITQVHFTGLKRTREQSMRWLMKSLEGTDFSSFLFAIDLQAFSNTGDLYEVAGVVQDDPQVVNAVQITVSVDDKWTLLPVFGGQGGGGALTYGGGLYDSNLLGTFTTASLLFYNYNGTLSYDLNFFNEFIAGTDTMGLLDWSNTITPTSIHNPDNTSAGNFTWQRQQEEVMVGTHLPGPIRLYLYADYFFDSMIKVVGVNSVVYPGIQYRFRPQVIFGRVNIVEFLEEGHETTLQFITNNPMGPVQAYQGVTFEQKSVFRTSENNNLAFNFMGATMSSVPAPYENQVGGYVNVRGYSDSRQVGPFLSVGNAEFRPFISKHRFHDLLGIFELDLVSLQGCLFTDFGSAWGDSTLTGDPATSQVNVLWSAGAGFRINFLHFAGAIIRFDLARTIRPDEGWGLSFGVGQFF